MSASNPLTLCFRDAALEAGYRQYELTSNRTRTRLGVGFGLLVIAIYAVRDFALDRNLYLDEDMRLFVALPMTLCALLATWLTTLRFLKVGTAPLLAFGVNFVVLALLLYQPGTLHRMTNHRVGTKFFAAVP